MGPTHPALAEFSIPETEREVFAEFFRDAGYCVSEEGEFYVYCDRELIGQIEPDATFCKIRLSDHCDPVIRKWERARGMIRHLVAGEVDELEQLVGQELTANATKVADGVLETPGLLY